MTKSDDELEEIAWALRKASGQSNTDALDVPAILNYAEDAGKISSVQVVSTEELRGAEAQYDAKTRSLKFTSDFFEKLSGNPRYRFTAVHELAHALLGHTEVRNRMQQRFARKNDSARDEAEANRLAAAILVPYQLYQANPSSDVEALASRFGVSLSTARIRLGQLDRRHRWENKKPFSPETRAKLRTFMQPIGSDVPDSDDYCSSCRGDFMVSVGMSRKCVNCGHETDDYAEYTNALSKKFPRKT